jgi:dCTP deaminase
MSILTHNELVQLVQQGVVEPVRPDQINAASIDLTLGDNLWIEDSPAGWSSVVDLHQKEVPRMVMVDLRKTGFYDIQPGQFVLASTREVFHLPNDVAAEYKLKSSLARAGLGHLLAGWADPGWHGSVLTLEFVNHLKYNSLRLRPGMRCGQMIFYRGEAVPDHASYAERGRYNQDTAATPSKGVR